MPLKHPYAAASVAQLFFESVLKLHDQTESIVCDSDALFNSCFWQKLACKVQVSILVRPYHPQTDGQTEVANRVLQIYLRCFVNDRPIEWTKCLGWAEYYYNTSWQSAITCSPLEAVYG